jgi:hypothetical protein
MGELEAATRRMWGLGEDPVGGVLSHDSGPGERAKFGVRKASTGLERGCSALSDVLSLVSVVGLGESEDFGFVT